MKNNISSNIPQSGISLASYSGKKVIERVGEDIIKEVAATRITERGGRYDDKRSEAAMEDRKKEGYF